MKMSYVIEPVIKQQAIELYKQGLSAQEVKDHLNLAHSVRQIQRWAKKAGVIRNMSEAFRLAISKNRVQFKTNPNKILRHKLPLKVRYEILTRDGFKCVQCGSTAITTRLQVDHKDEDKNNNNLNNLQVLCEECNKGKAYLANPHYSR